MNKPVKHLLAVTTLLAGSMAHAAFGDFPPVLTNGSAQLAFSDNGWMSLGSGGVSIRTPATLPGLPATDNRASYASGTRQLDLALGSFTISDDQRAAVATQSLNSLVEFRRTVVDEDNPDSLTRYVVSMQDVEVDLVSATIYAKLSSSVRNGLDAPLVTDLGRQAIFQATQVGLVGGTQGQITYVSDPDYPGSLRAHASGNFAGQLRMNTSTADTILGNLGLSTDANDPVAGLWRSVNWGTFGFTTSPVPEASTYAMFGIGLLGVGAMTRRRARA